jgi:hypothetical protein
MKKILVIAAMMAMFAACQSPEDKAREYVKDITEAYLAKDEAKVLELTAEMLEWYEGLDAADKAKVDVLMEGLDALE